MQLTADRFANFRCHYCQRLEHISRDCEKREMTDLRREKASQISEVLLVRTQSKTKARVDCGIGHA